MSEQFDDIERDSVVNISMGEAEILPPIKYPKFEELDKIDQLEVLTTEVVMNQGAYPIEILLGNLGISYELYYELIADPEYINVISEKSARHILAPQLPAIYKKLGEGAADGNDSKIKLVLQATSSLTPDSLTLINQNYADMSNEEIMKEIKLLGKRVAEDEDK